MDRAGLTKLLRTATLVEERGGAVFLIDSDWTAAERTQVRATMEARPTGPEDGRGWLCIRTGGTSGSVKFARHDEETLTAAARGFRTHFGMDRVNAVGVLPPHHVSGLMAMVRCAATGGTHMPWNWKHLEAGETPTLPHGAGDWTLSLVPTQLQRLLARPATVDWLRAFRAILIGGGPLWGELAETAATAGLRLAPGYGMTETAAMAACALPEEFLRGKRDSGVALPHARLTLTPEGLVSVGGDSVFRGYWPERREARDFTTEDLGEIDARGRLRILGRRDALILSGGKKIAPAEVEAALRATGEFEDVAVVGVPDPEWGEAVVACYPASSSRRPDLARARESLAPHQRPKRFVALADWPRNAQGKIDRAALRRHATLPE